ncbi:MAG: LPS export ABC transporter periplasmic protein LptC [Candidatus Andeanibacterium colombiense]|uniref:LPS export ABC transporter periplasmic protein LptC n=1 Tax=Candidatus Andeanibacterium colombiense TaxID=3121345 RepID=A0AAJ5X2E7_9SPHN|nr:MAG: LPS export ABC transporter periplasmic protein LptC [Sphingomonadaceae bacterium]
MNAPATASAEILRDRRQHFAAPGGAHDKLIRRLSTLLPAGIGVIAALMILTPLAPRGEVSFLLDRNKVAIAEDRLKVDNAMYRGEDEHGRPFSVVAGSAIQQSASEPIVNMRELEARLLLSQGPALLKANSGRYDYKNQTVAIDGVVQFTGADGYTMSARNVSVDLEKKALIGDGAVDGEIPAGTFSANRIRADLENRTVTLDGRARLRMVPGKLRNP